VILFLDFDGVLHDIGCMSKDLFRHASRFSAVLRDHPDIEVVVSSDWRKDAGSVVELAAHFPMDVRHRFIGLTAVESALAGPRQRERECWQWLHTHGRQHERWIAVDDWPDNFGPDLPGAGTVLFTDPSVGLDDEAVAILRAMIAAPAPATHFCYDRASLRGWALWRD
jgi:hypothetical protein